MKKIKLTRGKTAIVDDRDFALISHFKWHAVRRPLARSGNEWVAMTKICRHPILMHRLILNSIADIDHRDGDSLNNRRRNLRQALPSQNAANRFKRPGFSSRFKGVHRAGKQWRASIKHHGQHFYLGRFDDEAAAGRAYDKAAKRYFGRFARLNFPRATK